MAAAAAPLPVSDDHPLALQLASLRTAVARYQHEAHATSVKLQRHSLDTSDALDRAHALERENALLRDELHVLRTHSDSAPHPATLQVPELTLALRRLSDKLTLTEETLLVRTNELANARSDLSKARFETESAHQLAARSHAREEEAYAREHELEMKARAAEEERRLADLVVQEYADLVRSLEGRKTSFSSQPSPRLDIKSDSNVTLVDSLAEGKTGLKKLLDEFSGETGRLEMEINALHAQTALLTSDIQTERARAEEDRKQLAQAKLELDKYRIDDNTAAKMVSRYMKFSQSSTDSLQRAMESLKTRHDATTATLSAEVDHLHKTLLVERRQAEKLRSALDELSEDISREAFGRRREISLRLAFLGREESLAESLRRWIRKARESAGRAFASHPELSALRSMFDKTTDDAEALLDTLNGQPSTEENSIGSVARIVAAQDAVSTLTRELQMETDRRLQAERRLAELHVSDDAPPSTVSLVNGHTHDESPSSAPTPPPKSPSVTSHQLSPVALPELAEQLPLEQKIHSDGPGLTSSSDTEIVSVAFPSIPDVVVSTVDGLTRNDLITTEDSRTEPPTPVPIPESLAVEEGTPAAVPTPSLPPRSDSLKHQTAAVTSNGEIVRGSDLSLPLNPIVSLPSSTLHSPTSSAVAAESLVDIASTSVRPFPQLPETSESSLVYISERASDMPPTSSLLMNGDAISSDPITHESLATSTQISSNGYGASQPLVSSAQSTSQPMPSSLSSHQSLLTELAKVKHRYDDMQRAFRDCHLALKELKNNLPALPRTSDMTIVMQRAVERLNDFNEDARVELEIRITDEARITSGYETLLSVPGAMSDEVDVPALEGEMRAFAGGSDRAVAKAAQQFARKLDDLQHDIACVKRALYELAAQAEDAPAPSPAATASPRWAAWPASLLAPARPASPAPAPTFGSVMTSPRLRHASSFSHLRPGADDAAATGTRDPFASLGLRIPMPAHVLPATPLSVGPPRASPRPRASSAMYMLGLGSRSHFGLGGSASSPAKLSPIGRLASGDEDTEDDIDSDIE